MSEGKSSSAVSGLPNVGQTDMTPSLKLNVSPGEPRVSSGSSETLAADPEERSGSRPSVQQPSSSFADRELVAGRYEILGIIGAGGMGTVYRAMDTELEELVALKVLRADLAQTPHALDRFKREVKLARRVTHPNVARAFDLGEHLGARFLTMELVDGDSLSQLIALEKPMKLTRVVSIVKALGAGLQAAHDAGVLHRDLKPDNVLVSSQGRIVVTDFGIARALFEARDARTVGMPMGTPAYMAPEQVEAAPEVDARVDVYALGVILFEMLTGELPFRGDSVYAVASARLFQPPPDVRMLRTDLHEPVAKVLLRAMARKPADRFASIKGLVEGLEHALSVVTGPGETLVSPGEKSDPHSLSRLHATPSHRTPQPTPHPSPAPTPIGLHTPDPGVGTLAVLPFRNGGAPEDDYLAEGLTEDLIDLLSMTNGLKVRPRGVVIAHKNSTRDAQSIGAELGVAVVVEGSVRRVGETSRINARLISVADGFQIWAKRFDRPTHEFLSVSDEVANAVSEALTGKANEKAARVAPTDPAAVDLYLRGRHEYNRFDNVSSMRAVEFFDQARVLAPHDPLILTGYALARVRLWFFGAEGSAAEAKDAAERALVLAPQRGEPYIALAAVRFHEGDLDASVRLAREALVRAPALADAHDFLGKILVETGPVDIGLRYLETAVRLDPTLFQATTAIARTKGLQGNWDETFRLAEKTIDRSGGWVQLARYVVWLADKARAEKYLQLPQASQNPLATALLKLVLTGETSLDATALFSGRAFSWRTRALIAQISAELMISQGRTAEGLDYLKAAGEAGLIDLLWLDKCPLFTEIQSNPVFLETRALVKGRANVVRAALSG